MIEINGSEYGNIPRIKPEYLATIREETEEILQDPVFIRSPIQAKFMNYLLERALKGGPSPNQFDVAVEGLGRDPEGDFAHDSYPRVQVSRLRSNIEGYYSRNRPLKGSRVIIKPGSFQLELEPEEQAITARAEVEGNEEILAGLPTMENEPQVQGWQSPRTRNLVIEILNKPAPLVASLVMSVAAVIATILGVIAFLTWWNG